MFIFCQNLWLIGGFSWQTLFLIPVHGSFSGFMALFSNRHHVLLEDFYLRITSSELPRLANTSDGTILDRSHADLPSFVWERNEREVYPESFLQSSINYSFLGGLTTPSGVIIISFIIQSSHQYSLGFFQHHFLLHFHFIHWSCWRKSNVLYIIKENEISQIKG